MNAQPHKKKPGRPPNPRAVNRLKVMFPMRLWPETVRRIREELPHGRRQLILERVILGYLNQRKRLDKRQNVRVIVEEEEP
jgi:hypothetical protein